MALENVTYVNSLNPSNPGPLDSVSQGDDHIRNIKKALVDTFPYVNGQIPLTTSDFQDLKSFLDNGAGYDDTGVKNDIAALETGLASAEQDIISANNAIASEASTRKSADDAMLSQILRMEADIDAAQSKRFAAVTYNGSGKVGTAFNVGTIEWRDQGNGWRFAYIPFVTGLDGTSNPNANGGGSQGGNGLLDENLNIQVTAFSNNANSLGIAGFAYGVITEIDNYHCEIGFTQMDLNLIFQPVWNQAFCLSITRND
jgi:hypothetical protein